MARTQINVAMVGHRFMGKAHSNAYRQVARFFGEDPEPVLKVICGREGRAAADAARRYGWAEADTDWRRVVRRDEIDLVDIATPNDLHEPIALAAAKAGKHIICEKPLALDLAGAKRMLAAAERAGVKHMICHNYRGLPAVALARDMIQAGELGEIRQWRAVYLQDWIVDPAAPRAWRMDRSRAGSGAHGDINAHIIDLARMLVGEIDTVCGAMETFIKRRPLPDGSGRTGRVTVDDATAFLARFQNGVLGTFEATRMATGHRNDLRFEVNGSRGSVSFAVERLNELRYYAGDDPPGRRGFRTISVTDSEHPYGDRWWPPGHVLGWEHSFVHTVHELLQAIAQDRTPSPNFLDGARDQAVLDAVTESAQARAWVRVPRVTAPRRTGGRT